MTDQSVRTPTFFIVGAPKSGTTAWYKYLNSHPDVFLPREKELHHFTRDLLDPNNAFLQEDYYLDFFQGAGRDQLVGQVAVFDLYSQEAAANISSFCPDAKIIIMIRNPVDLMHSLHSQLVYNGDEDISDFGAALDAEEARKCGRLPVPQSPFRRICHYRDVADLVSQIERYYEHFSRRQVQIVVFDDLQHDTATTFGETLLFLGLPPCPDISFATVNSNKEIRSPMLRDLLLRSPPPWLKRMVHVMPQAQRRDLLGKFLRMNTVYTSRPAINENLRKKLTAEMAPRIDRLSRLVDRDLAHWYTDADAPIA